MEAYRFLGEGKNAASGDGAPFSNKAFNARLKLACQCARVPVIPTRFSIYQLRAVPFEAHTFLATDPK